MMTELIKMPMLEVAAPKMMKVITFVETTGEILMLHECSEHDSALQASGDGHLSIIVDVLPEMNRGVPMHYVDPVTRVVTERSTFDPVIAVSKLTAIADGTDLVIVSNVPFGSSISVRGPEMAINATADGTPIDLTFSLKGAYEITIRRFPNLDFKVSINAT